MKVVFTLCLLYAKGFIDDKLYTKAGIFQHFKRVLKTRLNIEKYISEQNEKTCISLLTIQLFN